MADEATTTDAAAETSGDSAEPTAETTEAQSTETVDYKDRFEAQQKVNRDLERKFKEAAEAKSALEARMAALEGKESEYQAAQEAKRLQDEMLAKANERIVGAELRAAAKGKVADDVLTDLALFIKPSDFEVGDDGSVDSDAIARAVDDLIKSKPSLAAQGSRFQGSADGGARNDATKPAQLSEADMARMTPEQIDEAHNKGQFDRLLGRT